METPDARLFVPATLVRYRAELALPEDDTPVSLKPLPKFEAQQYVNFEKLFDNYLKGIRSPRAVGLYLDYVARRPLPAGTLVSTLPGPQRIKYTASLSGLAYNADNQKVFLILKQSLIHTTSWAWISSHDGQSDGRGAILSLRRHFEGADQVASRRLRAKTAVETAKYTNEFTFSYEQYVSQLAQGFADLEACEEPLSENSKVLRFVDGINSTNQRIISAVEMGYSMHPNSFDACSSSVGTALQRILGANYGGNKKRTSKMAASGGERGRTRRGRGGRDGRGGRGGRNGGRRGGRNSTKISVPKSEWIKLPQHIKDSILAHNREQRGEQREANVSANGSQAQAPAPTQAQAPVAPTEATQVASNTSSTLGANKGSAFGGGGRRPARG